MKLKTIPLLLLIFSLAACEKEKKASGEFTVLTYNVAGLPEGFSSSHPELYTSSIGKLLKGNDVVHVQEDFCYHDSLLLFDNHPHRTTNPLGCAQGNDGLNTFSVFPISNYARMGYTDCVGVDCLTKKGFTYSQLDLGNGVVIDFYNTHVQASSDEAAKAARRSNVRELCTYINEHSAGKPVILMGDFNSRYTRDGDTIRAILGLGFKDAWVELVKGGVLPDYATPSLDDCDRPRTNNLCERVDKIFYRSNDKLKITVLSYQLDDDRFYFNSSDTSQLSDHWPMFARFSYEGE